MPAELQLLVIVLALLGFWAIVMRPARVQQRRVAELQAGLAVGDEVIISAGIFGRIVAMEDDTVELEIAPGTVITAARQVVVRRSTDPATDAGTYAGTDAVTEPGPAVPDDRTTEED